MTSKNKRRCGKRNAGFVLITTSAGILLLLGFLGLAVDVGFLQYQKRRIQSAADAAAMGAVMQLSSGATSATATTEGQYDSGLNGFTNASNGVTVTINIPPLSGGYTTSSKAVEALVTQSTPTYFMRLFGVNSVSVGARSVAAIGSSQNCIYALGPSAAGDFVATGGANISIGCGLQVNSTSTTALQCSNGATIAATSISVVGNYTSTGGCHVTPTPTTGARAASDPLAYLTAPATPTSCTYKNYSLSNGNTATINPGTYCNGINLSGGAKLYLNSGLYILEGGGLNISNGATFASNAGGVTFDNTGGAKISGVTYNYAPIAFSGGSTITLAAPNSSSTSGMEGILFFDRTGTSSSKQSMSNGISQNLTGALYFPTSEVDYSGGVAAAGDWTIIVANNLNFSNGSSAIGHDFSLYPDGSPIRQGGLFVE